MAYLLGLRKFFPLGWNLILDAVAIIALILSDVLSTSGFYLQHSDNETDSSFDISEHVYFTSELNVNRTVIDIPQASS